MIKNRLGAKAVKMLEKTVGDDEILNPADSTTFRALAAKANYLSLDRPDISYATKELCKHVSQPTSDAVRALKRLVKYLVGKPRVVWKFSLQKPEDIITFYVDTDFAGYYETRRSTNGGAAMRGTHLLKHYSNTQSTVALSSGEAELSGICRGASQGLGLLSVARDLGLHWKLDIQTDATAAIGICKRKGLGKIRHLATSDLWVQDKLRAK